MAQAGVAANKKGAKRKLTPILFLDESGFMLQPVRRRTWAPGRRRYKTPGIDTIDLAWSASLAFLPFVTDYRSIFSSC